MNGPAKIAGPPLTPLPSRQDSAASNAAARGSTRRVLKKRLKAKQKLKKYLPKPALLEMGEFVLRKSSDEVRQVGFAQTDQVIAHDPTAVLQALVGAYWNLG